MVRPLGPHSVSSIVSLPVLALIVCSFACSPLFRSCPSNFFRVCARSSVHAVSCVFYVFFFVVPFFAFSSSFFFFSFVPQHDRLEAEAVTKFHALRPPGIGVAE